MGSTLLFFFTPENGKEGFLRLIDAHHTFEWVSFAPAKVKEGAETQQMLVEKIVGLQRACARRQEKLDFLEEHVEQVLVR